jgi:hypothetical protein
MIRKPFSFVLRSGSSKHNVKQNASFLPCFSSAGSPILPRKRQRNIMSFSSSPASNLRTCPHRFIFQWTNSVDDTRYQTVYQRWRGSLGGSFPQSILAPIPPLAAHMASVSGQKKEVPSSDSLKTTEATPFSPNEPPESLDASNAGTSAPSLSITEVKQEPVSKVHKGYLGSGGGSTTSGGSTMTENNPTFKVAKVSYQGDVTMMNLQTSEVLRTTRILARDLLTLNVTSRQEGWMQYSSTKNLAAAMDDSAAIRGTYVRRTYHSTCRSQRASD